ncbi:MAG TPA: SPW repeat protein [Burkholderiales bacterium]|nr:SPW repeat protein [Burkholderiales bacterium]
MESRHWQDRANLVLGAWIFASPWVLAYTGSVAAWNAYAMGAGIMLFALIASYMPKAWEELINILFGVWLVVSPFALGFSADTVVALHTVVVGILATAFAIWAMSNEKSFYKRWHSGHSV